jgi:hypothetical protein
MCLAPNRQWTTRARSPAANRWAPTEQRPCREQRRDDSRAPAICNGRRNDDLSNVRAICRMSRRDSSPPTSWHTFSIRGRTMKRVRRPGLGVLLLAGVAAGACGGGSRPGSPAFESGSRLRARIYDGGEARAFIHWHDIQRDEDCSFARATDGVWRCLPDGNGIGYLDAACTSPFAVVPGANPAPSATRGDGQGGAACDGASSQYPVYAVGAPISVTSVAFYRDGATCLQTTPPDASYDTYALGAELDPSAFVAADLVDEARGRRLAARIFKAEDGAIEIARILDVRRGQECMLPPLALDEGPCLPIDLAWSIGEFADAACSQPTAYTSSFAPGGVGPGCPGPGVAVSYEFSACGDVTLGFNKLADAVSTAYSLDQNGQCVADAIGGHMDYRLGAAIPATDFADLFHDAAGGGRLRSAEIAARDGGGGFMTESYLPFFDSQLNRRCAPMEFCDGSYHCLPTDLPQSAPYYADAACSQRLALAYTSPDCATAPPPTRVIFYPPSGGCYTTATIYDLGAPRSPSEVWRLDSGGCVSAPTDQGAGFHYYAVGAQVPIDTYATVQLRTE